MFALRAYPHGMTPRAASVAPDASPGVSAFPAATAMVWPGRGHRHEAVAVPGVRLGLGDVLVELELSTVSPADVRVVFGEIDCETPVVLGNEQVGTVTALGPGTARTVSGRRIQLGDRVVWAAWLACGRCTACRRGLPQHCETPRAYGRERMRRGWELSGAFATHAHVRGGTTIATVPRAVPAAALTAVGTAGAHAVAVLEAAAHQRPLTGEVVVISGAGLLGLWATALAKDAGAIVIISDVDASRRAAALGFGADAVVDPRAGARDPHSFAAALRTVAKRTTVCRIGLELTGTSLGAREMLAVLDTGATAVLTPPSSPDEQFAFGSEPLARRGLTVVGVGGYLPRHLELAVSYVADAWQHRPFAAIAGEPLPLKRVDEALALASAGDRIRVALDPRHGVARPL